MWWVGRDNFRKHLHSSTVLIQFRPNSALRSLRTVRKLSSLRFRKCQPHEMWWNPTILEVCSCYHFGLIYSFELHTNIIYHMVLMILNDYSATIIFQLRLLEESFSKTSREWGLSSALRSRDRRGKPFIIMIVGFFVYYLNSACHIFIQIVLICFSFWTKKPGHIISFGVRVSNSEERLPNLCQAPWSQC